MNYDLLGETWALINNFLIFVSVFAVIVITLFCIPGLLLESNCTLICPELPEGIGCLGQEGIVQPHEAVAFEIINGVSPIFLKLKTWVTISPS